MVRILLDDSLDWYFGSQQVLDIINDAQIRIIDKYVLANNEFALRPLYYICLVSDMRRNIINDKYIIGDEYVNNNSSVINKRRPMYIRDVIVYPNYSRKYLLNEQMGFHSNYLNPEEFYNFESTLGPYFTAGGIFTTENYPHNIYYTITSESTVGLLSTTQQDKLIQFTYGNSVTDSRALVGFIAYPMLFTDTQTLQIEPTYHFEVCSLAAEMLNINDVGEKERGQAAISEFGQRLNIEQIGNIVNIPSQGK